METSVLLSGSCEEGMDAKKAAKVKKPFKFSKTKAFKGVTLVFLGLATYTTLFSIAYNQYYNRHPKNFRDNVIDKYFESDEYLLQVERAKGLAPPSKEQIMNFWKKYGQQEQRQEGSRPAM